MDDILTTLNHTTIEALGFKNITPISLSESIDTFVRGKITVTIDKTGHATTGIDGSRQQLTFEDLKAFIEAAERQQLKPNTYPKPHINDRIKMH